MAKKILLVPLVKKFIRDTANGKRRMANGQRIKHRSVANYFYLLKHLVEFEQFKGEPIFVTINIDFADECPRLTLAMQSISCGTRRNINYSLHPHSSPYFNSASTSK